MLGTQIGQIEGTFSGGSRRSLINLSRALVEKGHEVHIVATAPTPYCSTIDGIEWCNIHQVNAYGNSASLRYGIKLFLDGIKKIREINAKEGLNIIHSHAGDPKLSLLSGIAGKICAVPSLHTLYTPVVAPTRTIRSEHSLFSTYAAFSNPWLAKFCLSKVDCLSVLSNNIRASIERISLKKRIEVIPPGVDLNEFNPKVSGDAFRKKLGIAENENLVLLLGDRKAKGLKVLGDAIKQIKRSDASVKFVIGAGSNLDYVNSLSKEIKESAVILGVIRDVPSAIAASDIYVAPFLSTFDISDYPMSILEAMAVGKAIIASNVGGISEIIENGESGILTEPNNSDKLSEETASLVVDRRRREKLGENAYRICEEKFSIEKIAQRYEQLYKELYSEESKGRLK
jgi:glycosyltransferase involved in cell wall biosynthesis